MQILSVTFSHAVLGGRPSARPGEDGVLIIKPGELGPIPGLYFHLQSGEPRFIPASNCIEIRLAADDEPKGKRR